MMDVIGPLTGRYFLTTFHFGEKWHYSDLKYIHENIQQTEIPRPKKQIQRSQYFSDKEILDLSRPSPTFFN